MTGAGRGAAEGLPVLRVGEPLEAEQDLLRTLRAAVLAHPVAANRAFAALVREGRRYAQTPRGAEQLAALRGSRFVQRARLTLELTSSWMVEEEPTGATPSSLVDGLFMAATAADLEGLLDRLYEEPEP